MPCCRLPLSLPPCLPALGRVSCCASAPRRSLQLASAFDAVPAVCHGLDRLRCVHRRAAPTYEARQEHLDCLPAFPASLAAAPDKMVQLGWEAGVGSPALPCALLRAGTPPHVPRICLRHPAAPRLPRHVQQQLHASLVHSHSSTAWSLNRTLCPAPQVVIATLVVGLIIMAGESCCTASDMICALCRLAMDPFAQPVACCASREPVPTLPFDAHLQATGWGPTSSSRVRNRVLRPTIV